MGPEAAVNAVYANKIAEIERRGARRATRSSPGGAREYEEDVDLERLAADLVLDQVVEADDLRGELLHRLRYAARRDRQFATAPRRPAGLSGRRSGGVEVGSAHGMSQPRLRGSGGRQGPAGCAGRARRRRARASSSRSSGQRDADDVARVALDARDERAAQAVEGERAGHPQRLAGGDVGLDLGVVERRRSAPWWRPSRRASPPVPPASRREVDEPVAGVQDAGAAAHPLPARHAPRRRRPACRAPRRRARAPSRSPSTRMPWAGRRPPRRRVVDLERGRHGLGLGPGEQQGDVGRLERRSGDVLAPPPRRRPRRPPRPARAGRPGRAQGAASGPARRRRGGAWEGGGIGQPSAGRAGYPG